MLPDVIFCDGVIVFNHAFGSGILGISLRKLAKELNVFFF